MHCTNSCHFFSYSSFPVLSLNQRIPRSHEKRSKTGMRDILRRTCFRQVKQNFIFQDLLQEAVFSLTNHAWSGKMP